MTPGLPDRELVERHLLALDEALQILRRHRGGAAADLAENPEKLWIVQHGLQLCAQNVLDIATHLAASAGRDVADYGRAVVVLADLGVLPREFADRLRGLAGFRNVIVHAYLDVNVDIVHRLLNEGLEDFTEFAGRVRTYLASRPSA